MKEVNLRIKDFSINISIGILIPMVLFSILGELRLFIIALVFSLLHECAHLVMAKALGYKADKITLNMFGEVLHLQDRQMLPEREILIHIVGPVFNLMTALFVLMLYQKGINFAYCEDIILINTILGFFNLLPFYPLDGGKIVYIYLKYFMDEEIAKKILLGFAKLFLIFNFILGIYLVQYNLLNLLISLLSINIFLNICGEEKERLYKGILKAKNEQENRYYV